ncbi:MAG TPA: hypothetical protein VG711_06465 [Phycisphaerales bacterium]|nr:hypothetical protein [Phycisphaerales bacterium]
MFKPVHAADESDPRNPVDRCVCTQTTFVQMKQFADANKSTFENLQKEFSCGRGCALCVPYVKAMLCTGRTRFPVDLRAIK